MPGVDDPFILVAVVTDLDRNIGVGVAVIEIAPFALLEKFDENFFVVPGLGRDVGIRFLIALELLKLFLALIGRCLSEVLHDKGDDSVGGIFHSLDIEVDLGPDHVLRGLVKGCIVGIAVMGRAPVAAGHDDFVVC